MGKYILMFIGICVFSSCSSVVQNTKEKPFIAKKILFPPFKKVRSLSNEVVSIVNDKEGNVWVVEEEAVYSIENKKLIKRGLNSRFKNKVLNAIGAEKGFYAFFGKKEGDAARSASGYLTYTANSVKYYNGSGYVEVFSGAVNPFNCIMDSKGRLWLSGKDNKLTILDGEKSCEIAYSPGQKETAPLKYYEDTKSRIWIYSPVPESNAAHSPGIIDGLLCYDRGTLYSVAVKGKTNDEVAGILELPSGELLVSFSKGGSWLFEYKILPDSNVALVPKGISPAILKDYIISDSLLTKNGRIIMLAADRKGRSGSYLFYSIFMMQDNKITLLMKNIEHVNAMRNERGNSREMKEDGEGSVWINGGEFCVLKILADGSIKEYNWTDGLLNSRVKNIVCRKQFVYIFAANDGGQGEGLNWSVYDNSFVNSRYDTGWEHFNSLCLPEADSKGGVWFVDASDGWLKKYNPAGNEKALDVFGEIKKINKIDGFWNPELINICAGVEDDIWIIIRANECWVLKYKDGVVKRSKLKFLLRTLFVDQSWKKLSREALRKMNAAFSDDGYIVLADFYEHNKFYIYNTKTWELLESADINKEEGLELSKPELFEGGLITVSLRSKNRDKESKYTLVSGKWQLTKNKVFAEYSSDYFRSENKILVTGEGTSFSFSGNSVFSGNSAGKNIDTGYEKIINFGYHFSSGEFLWLAIAPGQWKEKQEFIWNDKIYPVYGCNYAQLTGTPLIKVSTAAGRIENGLQLDGALDSTQQIIVLSEADAYKYLKSGSTEESRAAEIYFSNAGEKGRDYLNRMLKEENDERMRWIIEALLSR